MRLDSMTSERPLRGLRVLIVEDQYFIADDLRRMLEDQGAGTVMLSGSVDDAFRQIQKDGFEFALLDINIRGDMDFRLADELVHHKVPFAFVSGYDRTAIPARFEAVPNWGKPYSDHQVIAGIRRLWRPPDGPGA